MRTILLLTVLTLSQRGAAAVPTSCTEFLADRSIVLTLYVARFREALDQHGALIGILRHSIPFEIVTVAAWGNVSMPTQDVPDAMMSDRFPLKFTLSRSPFGEGLMLSAVGVGALGVAYDLFEPKSSGKVPDRYWSIFSDSDLREIVAILAAQTSPELPEALSRSIKLGRFAFSRETFGSRLALRITAADFESTPAGEK